MQTGKRYLREYVIKTHIKKMNCHSLLNDSSFCFERQFIFLKRINGNFRTTDLQYRELHLL